MTRSAMRRTRVLLAAAGAGVVVCSVAVYLFATGTAQSDVFATVNGRPLFVSELKRNLDQAGGTGVSMPFPELVRTIADDMIAVELIVQRYEEDYDPTWTRAAIVEAMLKAEVHDAIEVTDADVSQAFEERVASRTDLEPGRFAEHYRRRINYERSRERYDMLVARLRAEADVQVFASNLPR